MKECFGQKSDQKDNKCIGCKYLVACRYEEQDRQESEIKKVVLDLIDKYSFERVLSGFNMARSHYNNRRHNKEEKK